MHVPHIHVGADVGEAELAEQPFPFIAELRLDRSGIRAELSRICGMAAFMSSTSNLAREAGCDPR